MRIRISSNSNLFRFLSRFRTRFFLVLQALLNDGKDLFVPFFSRVVQGGPARIVFLNFMGIEKIGV